MKNPKKTSFEFPIFTLMILGLIGIWVTGNFGNFNVPAENNLQTLILLNEDQELTTSTEEIHEITESGSLTRVEMHNIATSILQNWSYELPHYVTDGENQYTLSDSFGLLGNALRYYNQNNTLPEKFEIQHLVNPGQNIPIEHGTEVRTQEIMSAVDTIEIHNKVAIPSIIHLDTIAITSPQMLHAMAQIYLHIESGDNIRFNLYIPPTGTFE